MPANMAAWPQRGAEGPLVGGLFVDKVFGLLKWGDGAWHGSIGVVDRRGQGRAQDLGELLRGGVRDDIGVVVGIRGGVGRSWRRGEGRGDGEIVSDMDDAPCEGAVGMLG